MWLKSTIRALLPAWLLSLYHWKLAWLAAACYGFPGRRLAVIGVTGTKGKSTTAALVWHVLQSAGYKVGLISTAQLSTGSEPRLNDLKMTMPSRFWLQRYLRSMVAAGCTHAVVETSSEGLAQWRHLGINYRVAVFTNLAPEHLEAHGSFAAYRAAKGKLFKLVGEKGGTAVVNLDDKEAPFFLSFTAPKCYGYTLRGATAVGAGKVFSAKVQEVSPRAARFTVNGVQVTLPVGGEFNIYNALAALGAVAALGVPLEQAAVALADFPGTPGRLEYVEAGQPFNVVVDYAHTPESLEAVYRTLMSPNSNVSDFLGRGNLTQAPSGGRLIALLGSCGGGRDKAKREPLGNLAGRYADFVVVTNEDPYDEDPMSIMESVARGARAAGKRDNENLFVEPDRRLAIARALRLARAGDTIIITGKGAEQWLCVAGNKKIPWDDRTVVREELAKISGV